MTNDEKISYHSANAYMHLCELLNCQLPQLSKDSRQAISATISVVDRLSNGHKPNEEVPNAG